VATGVGGNQSGLNFERVSYSISGNITQDGVGAGGATVTVSGAMGQSTTTAANGNFSLLRLRTGNYTITPSQGGYLFLPATRTTSLGPNRSGQNFTRVSAYVTTLPASEVAFGDATLNGTVAGEGTLTNSVWFEYGTNGLFDVITVPQVLPPGASVTPVGASIQNLLPGVIYNFRIVAANVNGTNYGTTVDFAMPYPGASTAANFDGTDDYVTVPGPVIPTNGNFTVECWARLLADPDVTCEILSQGTAGNAFYIGNFGGNIRVGDTWQSPGVPYPVNGWHHFAVVKTNNNTFLYVDGVLSATNGSPISNPSATEFRIGRQYGSLFQYWQGSIDEVRVWNVARSGAEIQQNYQRHLSGSEFGLVAYFRFNEQIGSTSPNSIPNASAATMRNGAALTFSGALVRNPVVVTLTPTPVLATRATLHGTVNPAASGTVAYFEYGETIAYGKTTTPGEDMGDGITNAAFSAAIAGLQPGTTYHFRSVAQNSFGITFGEDQTFTTLVLGVGWPSSTKVTGGFASSPRHVVDAEGSAYMAGLFSGSATFKNTLNASNNSPDAFVAKLGRGADWLWDNRIVLNETGTVAVTSIAVDGARNVYVAGRFTGVAMFGTNQLTAGASGDIFVAKLDGSSNTWNWARSAGGAQPDSANALAVTPAGAVFVAGHFRGSVTFGTNNLSSTSGSQDIFAAKLDTDGNWLWARSGGGAGANDSAFGIVLNSVEDAFITGSFQGTGASFGTLAPLNALGGASDTDLFVASISTDGLWLLARRGGGNGVDSGNALAIDGAGQVYLLGQFAGTADYNNTVSNLNVGADTRLFVAKLNASANMLWYAQAGIAVADSISVDNVGRVYISGEFGATTVSTRFGEPADFTLVSSGNTDVFLARLDAASGGWVWAKRIGSSGAETRGSIGVDAQGGVVVSGTYQNTVPIGFVLLTTPNERDIFVARLDPDGVFEHNTYVIGEAIPVPEEAQRVVPDDGGAIAQPTITILEKDHADSDALNSFVWDMAEHKLYPVRPVTAILKWPLTDNVTNTTSFATAVGRAVWPKNPQLHVANAPVELEPAVTNYPYRFPTIAFSTIAGADIEPGAKRFNAPAEGWTVLQLLKTGGETPNPSVHPIRFQVARTILWNGTNLVDNQTATIGAAVTDSLHNDPTGKNGFVYFEKALYDGTGNERAYDRATRTGPIIPVNKDTPAPDDDFVVAWYRTNALTGIAWPSLPMRYLVQWPTNADQLVLASGQGAELEPLNFPSKRVYNQPDATLAGYNPNEEHAALYGDTLYALRNDLNAVIGVSEPFTLLKYRNPTNNQWAMKVFHVAATNATNRFAYGGEAGKQLELPAPLSLLPLCVGSNTWVSGPGFKDHQGRLYARAAGLNNTSNSIVARYWYPLQPGFFYDLDRNGTPDAPVGDCVPWLDRRVGGLVGVPVNVTYNINWPENVPALQIGEALFHAKLGLPGLRNFARAQVIFDEGDPSGTNGVASLARLFDPLAPRTIQLRPNGSTDFLTGFGYSVFRVADADLLFQGIATAFDVGLQVFTGLPYTLRSRLRYDPLNKNLIFTGLLDESQNYGGKENPLLLLNVLSPRERDRIQELSGNPAFDDLISALYNLTRNPNQLDLDGDDQPDQALLAGLTKTQTGDIVPEALGDGPKVLTAGKASASGYLTVVENNDPSLGGLPVTLHIIRVEGGPFRGDIKVVQSDNVFDEKLSLRHSADFAGEPQNFEFEWFYRPVEANTDPTMFPSVLPDGDIGDLRGWTQYSATPPGPTGLNEITLGDGGTSSLLVLADNYFVCRYRGYVINGATNWSDWVGVIGGGQAQLAEGWVKRVRDGLNPFEARTREFHANETVTFASMLQQAGTRYEGPIAFNPGGGNINSIGLIEAYQTVLDRARDLSIEASPPINFQPANDALLLAAGFISDLYMLLGNEAYADAADPTIGFRTDAAGYGTLAPSIFAFQNQVDSLLEEELALLRGRDDRSATVRLPPVYNRLFWNFTRDEGEVAYAQAYNLTDQNSDGIIDATDARIMYPQAHGDAWGHYLTATKTYYSLLQNPSFDWIPRTEPILLSGVPVNVDYLDERKFARAAAAKAKTGAEIADLTYRLNYVDDPAGQYQGYKDTDSERAWGVSEWAHRAGSAAFFDWVIANAILPATDPNTNHTGLTRIDRTTVLEIGEIVSGYDSVQNQVDKADTGLNPLGLAKNAVPFDIDPTQISAGKTHFEQIYERAIAAVNNTVTVFNHANQLSQALRSLQDTVNDFTQNVQSEERDYKNRMIEIFGYPYAGDIGTGKTYPSGYDGPDIYHYMYVNTLELNGDTAPPSQTFTAFFDRLSTTVTNVTHYFPDDLAGLQNQNLSTSNILEVSYPYTASDFGFVPPSSWGQRRAPGEIQLALSDLVQSEARMKQALLNYNNLLEKIDDQVELLEARYGLRAETLNIRDAAKLKINIAKGTQTAGKVAARIASAIKDRSNDIYKVLVEGMPKVVGTATDAFAPARSMVLAGRAISRNVLTAIQVGGEVTAEISGAAIGYFRDQAALDIEAEQFEFEVQQHLKALEELIRQEPLLRAEVFQLGEKVNQNAGRYQAAVAKGLRLADERIAFRKTAAAETQASRYQDMTFRIFRNDAIQKYRAQFDLAAQYVFLAAEAYDFETQLLGGHSGSGREFLTDIIRQRSLGQVENGAPIAGRHGLADPLARLNQNFGVLKGQLGFNNPQTETGRFSLRSGLFRISTNSNEAWRAELRKSIVPDLWDVPEFRRYCRPFAPESAGPQPGLVIRFSTTINFGLNYFGWPLGGGDSAYDPTLFATKVRSAGVWFSDYSSSLSATPRIYLVPAGADIMRSPSGNNLETREWRVVDQKIPVPFPIGFSSLNNAGWIPMNDSLSDTFADIRRFSSFRAYNDSGGFTQAEATTDSRLIGRSVWNTDWMLIIPGGTFLFDPNQGLDTFINSVSDIKIFFQTYAYSGN
jgi:hypothetical protein